MMNEAADDPEIYRVVRNDEEQYSIWLARKPIPDGWHDVGEGGSREHCLAYIEEVWTDMRPRSLREQMDAEPG